MKKYIFRATGALLLCLLLSCDFFPENKQVENVVKTPPIIKDSVINPYTELFKPLKPVDKNCGLLLSLNTITGFRTIYIKFENGESQVIKDYPGIIYPYHDSLIFIRKIEKDSVFGDLFSGWPPKKTIHYWEELHYSKDQNKLDSLYRNTEKHLRQPFYIYTKENYIEYDSQFIDINYLIGFHINYNFSNKKSINRKPVFYNSFNLYKADTNIRLLSVKPDGLTFINENSTFQLRPSALIRLFSPNEIKILLNKIKKELYNNSIKNNFADTTPPPMLLGKLKADTTELFFTLRRENGIVKLFANAYALTNNFELSQTYKLRVEYDCGQIKQPYISHNSFPLTYNLVASTFKEEIIDALISPSQNIFLKLTNKSLEAFEVKTGKKLLSYKLPTNSKIIMTEWFNDKYFKQLDPKLSL